MASDSPVWEFILSADTKSWFWRFDELVAGPFASLDAATENAVDHGFDPLTKAWTSNIAGRLTHHHPGQAPLEMARRHVAEGELMVAQQLQIVQRLHNERLDTREADAELKSFRKILVEMRTHLRLEEEKSTKERKGD